MKNEERFLWFAVTSVISHLDKLLLWDTGSTDNTLEVVDALKFFYPDKIEVKKIKNFSPKDFAAVRQQMLDETEADWIFMLDADEVWWDKSVKRAVKVARKGMGKYESIVVPTVNMVGDVFHHQEEEAGRYKLAGRLGHYNLRLVNKNIEGLASSGPHGTWGWVDSEGKMIQDREAKKIKFIDSPYLHATFLRRSANEAEDSAVFKRSKKFKFELGKKFPNDFYYPEAFFKKRPDFIPSPWRPTTPLFNFRAFFETPARKIKRRLWQGKAGY